MQLCHAHAIPQQAVTLLHAKQLSVHLIECSADLVHSALSTAAYQSVTGDNTSACSTGTGAFHYGALHRKCTVLVALLHAIPYPGVTHHITPCRPWPSIAIMCFCLLVSIVRCIGVPLVVAYDLARPKWKMARLYNCCSLVHCECATCTQQLPLHIFPRHYTDVVTSCFGKPDRSTLRFASLQIWLALRTSLCPGSISQLTLLSPLILLFLSAAGIANHLTGVDHSHPLCFEGPKLAVLGVACVVRS